MRVSLRRSKPFPKKITDWPQTLCVITLRDGDREAWFNLALRVCNDSRGGIVGVPYLSVYRYNGRNDATTHARGYWRKSTRHKSRPSPRKS